jgi:O-antigen/teichoic acid export membrane protein
MSLLKAISAVVVPMFTFPYLSRVLGPASLGEVTFAASMAEYAALLAAVGIPVYGVRAIARAKDDPARLATVARELISIHLATTLLVGTLFLLSIFFVDRLHSQLPLFVAASFVLFFYAVNLDWYFQGTENYTYITYRALFFSIVGAISVFVFVRTEADYVLCGVITAATFVGGALTNLFMARKVVLGPVDFRAALARHARPLAVAYVMNFFTSIYLSMDMIILGFMAEPENVGYYGVSTKIMKIMFVLVSSIVMVLSPRLSYYAERNMDDHFDALVNKSYVFTILIVLPAVCGIVALGQDMIALLAGDRYEASFWALAITAPVLLFSTVSNILGGQILYPKGREKAILRAVVAGAVVSLVTNYVLIRQFQHVGAATALLVSEIAVCAFMWSAARSATGGLVIGGARWIRIGVSVAAMCATLMLVRTLPLGALGRILLGVPLGALVYGAALALQRDPVVQSFVEGLRRRRAS